MVDEGWDEDDVKKRWLRTVTHPQTIEKLSNFNCDIFFFTSHFSLATAIYRLFIDFALDYAHRLSHHWHCLPLSWRDHIMTVQLVCRRKGLPRPLVNYLLLDYCAVEWRRQTLEEFPACFKHVITTMSHFNNKQTQRFAFVNPIKVNKKTIVLTSPKDTLLQLKKEFF